MEVLGFYDEPYVVRVAPQRRPIGRPVVTAEAPRAPSADATSRVAGLWETTQIEENALEWWRPQVISRRRLGGRRVRLSSLVMTVAAIVMVVVGVSRATSDRAEQAQRTREVITVEAASLREVVPRLSDVIRSLDDPAGPDLATSTEVVLSAESAARTLFSAAGGLGEDDADVRAASISVASDVLEVTSTVNRLLAYRLAVEGVLQPPPLPDTPTSQDLAAVTEAVTGWRVEVELALEEIASSALPGHHEPLQGWVAGLDRWQAAYLDSVRQDDADAVGAARADLESQLASLGDDMRSELSVAGGELLSQLGDATAVIDRLLGD